jgi:DNA-binding PadR family transcriptional regulator
MSSTEELNKYLPLTEATYYIMLALIEPRHGYAIMRKVADMTHGSVKVGPGTLYGALANLEKDGLIGIVNEEKRRKIYTLTLTGRRTLLLQLERLGNMIRNGADAFNWMSPKK